MAPSVAGQQLPATPQPPASIQRSRPYRRMQWFYEQRSYPLGYIPSGARQDALNQLEQMITNESRTRIKANVVRGLSTPANGSAPGANGATWSPMGPQPTSNIFENSPVSGRLSAVVIDPNNANTIYVGAAMGGVWKSTDGGANWTALTDNQPTLAVGSVTLDDTGTLWVGTGEDNFGGDNYYGVGILKSADGGTTWTQVGQSTFSGAIAPTIGGARIGQIAVLPGSNGQIAIAAVQFYPQSFSAVFTNIPHSGVWRTTDGGNTWTIVLDAAAGNAVAWDPNNPKTCGTSCIAYATIGGTFFDSTDGFYRSTDSGVTWTKATASPLPSTNVGRIAMGLAKNTTGNAVKTTIYLGIDNSSTGDLLGMYKSTDGGVTWSQLSGAPNYCTGQCWYDNVIGVLPSDPNVVFAGGAFGDNVNPISMLWRSTDGGTTWSEISKSVGTTFSAIHADLHAITFSPDNSTIYVGTDGGIYSSANAPNSATAVSSIVWNDLNASATDPTKSLATLQIYPGMSVTSANYVFAGTQDNGSQLFTGSYVWAQMQCGDGGWSAIDPGNPNNLFTACNSGPIDIEKSTTNPPTYNTFVESDTGITLSDRALFIPPMVMDPANSSTLYFGSFKLYQSINAASSWNAMAGGADLTGGSNAKITTIAVGPNNTVWIGTSGGNGNVTAKVQVTTNANFGASATFTDRTSGLPNRSVTQVVPDFADTTGATAYVTFSGFDSCPNGSCDGLGYVYKTTNTGANWTNITGNLPHSPVNDLVVDPSIANTLYVATDVGVFYTSNANASPPTWSTLVSGFPKSAVLSLKMHAASRTLIAGTHGRSAWRVVVGGVATASPTSLTFGQQGFNLSSLPQAVVIMNPGSAAVTLNTISINSAEFAIASPSGTPRPTRAPVCATAMVLGAGSACLINVTFTPSGSGTRTGTLTVNNTGAVANVTVGLTGTGPTASAVSLLPSPVSFGNVVVNTQATMPVALNNATASSVAVSNFTLPAGYSQTNNCPANLAAGAGCVVTVTFRPTSLAGFSGNLSVTDAVGTQTTFLSGTGADPSLTLSRPGTVAGTNAAGASTLTLSHPPLPVRSSTTTVLAGTAQTVPIVFTPAGAAGVAYLSCFGAPDGATCDVEPSTLKLNGDPAEAKVKIEYADSPDAARRGTYQVQVLAKTDSFSSVLALPFELVSSKKRAPRSDSSTGTKPAAAQSSDEPAPPAFELSPSRLEFTSDDRKQDASAREITVTNKQSSALTIAVDSVTGDFVQTNDCGEVQPGGACKISVRIKPDVPFPTGGRLNITTSAGTASVELGVKNLYHVRPQD